MGFSEVIPTELGDALNAVDFGGSTAVDVCLGATFACALLDTDAVRCWGRGERGELGFADLGPGTAIGDAPAEIAAFPDVPLVAGADAISCGQTSACARLIDGRYSCWGDNRQGALGLERADDVVASIGGVPLNTLPLSP
jgi:alpha-tubulin suppressor-like RCC1 family protein